MRPWQLVAASAWSAFLLTAADVGGPLRVGFVLWFLIVCPGLGFVRMLGLADRELQLALTIGASIAIDALATLPLVAADVYTPLRSLALITAVAITGTTLDAHRHPAPGPAPWKSSRGETTSPPPSKVTPW